MSTSPAPTSSSTHIHLECPRAPYVCVGIHIVHMGPVLSELISHMKNPAIMTGTVLTKFSRGLSRLHDLEDIRGLPLSVLGDYSVVPANHVIMYGTHIAQQRTLRSMRTRMGALLHSLGYPHDPIPFTINKYERSKQVVPPSSPAALIAHIYGRVIREHVLHGRVTM